MFQTTLPRLKCPNCEGSLRSSSPDQPEMHSGFLECVSCSCRYPVLAGVAIVVADVQGYLLHHVKGIAQLVPDREIPDEFLEEYLAAKSEIESEHIEEDLEAERVTALYLMNHYLRAHPTPRAPWWKPKNAAASPLIDSLIQEHWDQGPFSQIRSWTEKLSQEGTAGDLVELGCGVGGLYSTLRSHLRSYLGVDSSFASVALARHLALGMPYPRPIRVPEDLLQGTVSREVQIPAPAASDGTADFIVGDLEQPPLHAGQYDLSIALNAIDMLEDPSSLPRLQNELLRSGGWAMQSCPYIWHERVSQGLRELLPAEVRDSASAAEWLYRQAGFEIRERVENLPWLFFKHVRQLEIYSVHLFTARKSKLGFAQ